MKKLYLCCTILLLLYGCNSENNVESNPENNVESHESSASSKIEVTEIKTLDIDISEYFPPLITRNSYRVGDSTIISVAKSIVGQDNITTRVLEETEYFNGNISQVVTLYYVSKNQISTEKEIVLMNQSFWENEETTYEIIDTNSTVSTEAGTFENCISLIKTDKQTGMKGQYFYAPKVGLIKLILNEQDLELVSTHYSPYGNSKVESDVKEEDLNIEEFPSEDFSPTPLFDVVSAMLPKTTGKTSALTIREYERAVNNISSELESLVKTEDNYLGSDHYIKYSNGVTISIDEKNRIKEVKYQRVGPDEEAFLVTQKLILGLDTTLSIDDVNDNILFSGKKTTYTIGEFEIGIEFDDDYFTFLAVVK